MEKFIFAGAKLEGKRIRESKIDGVLYVWFETHDGTTHPIKKSELIKNK